MNLNVSVPINNLSFGNVSYNLLKALYEKGLSPCVFPVGQPDVSTFDRISQDFSLWLQSCINKSLKSYKKDSPEIRLWHFSGSDTSHSKNQILISFWECDQPTEYELNIVKNQYKVFLTSRYAVEIFKQYGADNVEYLELGFDNENFRQLQNPRKLDNVINFFHSGKWEPNRKGTDKIIRNFIRKYGNNGNYRLNISCHNQFLHQDPAQCAAINQQLIQQCFDGKTIWNVSPVKGYLQTLSEYNMFLNQGDIYLDISGNESIGLPAFHSTGLGKHIVTHFNNGVKDWATAENAVLVNSNGKNPAADGMFFHKDSPFNMGNFFTCSDDEFIVGMEAAELRYRNNPINKEGLKLQNRKWSNTLDTILNSIK